ncbi:RHS repeat domain-containing protein [Streptomyces sp. NPDC005526]|uniref:RHS repeat domain-containing protein n=1 Tax=Streptomyces sp. NPDC005526 TaxID=3156885 RepID=UPI0033B48B27
MDSRYVDADGGLGHPQGPLLTTGSTDRDRTTTRIQSPAEGDTVTTSYDYNAAGLLKKVTDDAGNTWSHEYDQLGRMKTAVDPDTSRVRSARGRSARGRRSRPDARR